MVTMRNSIKCLVCSFFIATSSAAQAEEITLDCKVKANNKDIDIHITTDVDSLTENYSGGSQANYSNDKPGSYLKINSSSIAYGTEIELGGKTINLDTTISRSTGEFRTLNKGTPTRVGSCEKAPTTTKKF